MTKRDSLFLCAMELMDYSVFLVKLTLSKKEQIDIFGQDIRKKQDQDFNDLLVSQSIKTNVMGDEPNNTTEEQNIKIDESIKPTYSIQGEGKIYNIKHYRQFLYPSLIPGNAYILAIIDYFQMFNFYKFVESGIKTKFAKDAEGVSCVDPKTYSKRFIQYFIKLTDIKQFFKDNKMDESNIDYQEDDDYEGEKDDSAALFEDTNIELETIK